MTLFWNRENELKQIRKALGTGRFGYVTGRRRVGKTAILRKACEDFHGLYHQAVEGTPEQQLLHLTEEIRQALPIFQDVMPKNWIEFFRLLSREKLPRLLVFDEFPYWAQSDPSLASVLQKWIDHEMEKMGTLLLVSGSSQSMLNSQFLSRESPLYGRAHLHLHLEPMSFRWFCQALHYDPADDLSFTRFSLVGGVPHFWKLMSKGSPIEQAEALYFEPSALLAEEPTQWLREEGVSGFLPKAMLDLIGRGVAKPSELAARLNTAHSNLSRPLGLLLDLGFVTRETPFGQTPRNTKKVLYKIVDPSLSFYFGTYLPHRSRWNTLEVKEKERLLSSHTASQWEIICRQAFPGAARYWEDKIEIDLVAPRPKNQGLLVAECKWSELSVAEEAGFLKDLKLRWNETQLSRTSGNVDFRIFSKKDVGRISVDAGN